MCSSLSQLQAPDGGFIAQAPSPIYSARQQGDVGEVAFRISEAMARLCLLIASAFVLLQLTQQVAADTGRASFYTAPFLPSACFGFDESQFPPNGFFAAGGDSPSANIWNNGQNCGKFFRIQCQGNGCRNNNFISVKIVERCPNGCVDGRAFDLSDTAFAAIADPNVGVITVNYFPA